MNDSNQLPTRTRIDEFALVRAATAGVLVTATLGLVCNAFVPVVSPRVAGGVALVANFAGYTAAAFEFYRLLHGDKAALKASLPRMVLIGACMGLTLCFGPACRFDHRVLVCSPQKPFAWFE